MRNPFSSRTLYSTKGLGALLALGLLGACGPSKEQEEASLKAAAQPATYRIVAQEYATAPPVVMGDCVVEQASEAELVILAQAQLQGIRGADANLVRTIVSRPETRACLQAAGLRSGSY